MHSSATTAEVNITDSVVGRRPLSMANCVLKRLASTMICLIGNCLLKTIRFECACTNIP